jgi:hypothetical protein
MAHSVSNAVHRSGGVWGETKRAARRPLRRGIKFAKKHPLALAAAAATAGTLARFQVGLGVLVGMGFGTLLARRSWPEARHLVAKKSRLALKRARTRLARRASPKQQTQSKQSSRKPKRAKPPAR